MTALDKAIKHFGSQRAMASAMGVSPMAVTQWLKRGLPMERALQLHELTNGEIPCFEFHPELKKVMELPAA